MARRPDPFDEQSFRDALRRQGCPESFISPVTSDFRLFVPLVLSKLGEERLFQIVNDARSELGLGEQTPAWKLACQQTVEWAKNETNEYASRKAGS